jgi:glycosyltransferase involved in cell wall biosynthesis
MKHKPIEVCLIVKDYHPIFSGAAERFRHYAPGLRARGIRLRVFTVQQGDSAPFEVIDDTPIHRAQLNVDPRSLPSALLKTSFAHFRDSRNWPDVLHLLNHSLHAVPYLWLARLQGTPSIFTATMVNEARREQHPGKRLKIALYHRLRFLPFSCITASSGVMKEAMVKQGVAASRIEVIPNGVDLKRFYPPATAGDRELIRRQLGFGVEKKIILFVGAITPRKGVDLLARAWSEIAACQPDALLILAGPRTHKSSRPQDLDDSAFVKQIDQAIKDSGASDRTVFTGSISNIDQYMRAADVFVFPSRREGMGNVVAEAMATGLPCVLTPYEGLPAEFGRPGQEFLLSSHRADELASTVLGLLENEGKRRSLGQAARCWTEAHLVVEGSLDRYANVYRRLAGAQQKRL